MDADAYPNADRDALYALFEREPGDAAAYGAMGDLMDELGYAKRAHAYRWMARRRKWPHLRTNYANVTGGLGYSVVKARKCPAKFRFAWYMETYGSAEAPAPGWPKSPIGNHWLPSILIPKEQHLYPSHAAAVEDLAKWLHKLRAAWELDEPKRGGL